MAKVVIERFDGGMSDDRYEYSVGQSSVVKGFDLLTFPHRLFPTLTSIVDTTGTGIGNLIVGSDGTLYGLGADAGNPTTNSQLYNKATANSAWAAIVNAKTGSGALNFDMLVEYKDTGTARTMHVSGNGGIAQLDPTNGLTVNTHTLSYTSITQGIIHPKDDIMYFGYTTSSGTFIGLNNANTWNDTALQLPTFYIVTSISFYGNYLAIMCAPRAAFTLSSTGKILAVSNNGGSYRSVVYLWDRDTSLATISEVIDWGTGIGQVLNNLNGKLIGISNVGGNSINIDVRNSIIFKEYAGTVPQVIHEISTEKQTTTQPSVNINPLVNFSYRNRLYFSIDIVGGSTSPTLYGLWSMGKSNSSNQYAIGIEYGATSDNSETSVKAAAILGDYASTVYTANGTLGFSVVNTSLATKFSCLSFYESCVNPGMLLLRNTRMDFSLVKQLQAVSLSYFPLVTGQQITLKYRVDSNSGATGTLGSGWTTIATYTPASESSGSPDDNQGFERMLDAAGSQFTSGRFYEFRIESAGGAQILEFAYKFEILKTNLVE